MLFNQAMLAAQTAFHFGDRATFIAALRFAQAAAGADDAMVRQLSAAMVKFPANEALEIVNTAQRQHRSQSAAGPLPAR